MVCVCVYKKSVGIGKKVAFRLDPLISLEKVTTPGRDPPFFTQKNSESS